jgi:hypothetical protein
LEMDRHNNLLVNANNLLDPLDDNGKIWDFTFKRGTRQLKLGRYVSRHVLPVAKFEKVPLGKMYGVGDGFAEPNLRNTLVRGSEIVYTWHDVPNVHRQELRIQRYLGTINRYKFDGFPAGTLRLDGMMQINRRAHDGILLSNFLFFINHVDRNLEQSIDLTGVGLGHNFVSIYGEPQSADDIRIRFVGDTTPKGPFRDADWSYIFLPYDEPLS